MRGIRDDKLRDVRKRVSDPVLETFAVEVQMWTRQTFICPIRGIRRISVGRPIQIQTSENHNLSCPGLVFETNPLSIAAFNRQEKLFPSIA